MKLARASGKDLGISTKHSLMICNIIRGKNVASARKILLETINMKKAIPFTKFNMDRGHKKGMMAGRYPVKSCKEILKLLNSAESNAKDKDMEILFVKEIKANKASTPVRYGRKRRRKMKRTHIEIILGEIKKEKKDKK